MLDSICPAITDTLAWLPWLIVAAVLADAAIVLAGVLILRTRPR